MGKALISNGYLMINKVIITKVITTKNGHYLNNGLLNDL